MIWKLIASGAITGVWEKFTVACVNSCENQVTNSIIFFLYYNYYYYVYLRIGETCRDTNVFFSMEWHKLSCTEKLKRYSNSSQNTRWININMCKRCNFVIIYNTNNEVWYVHIGGYYGIQNWPTSIRLYKNYFNND